jgi:hypothetical protein
MYYGLINSMNRAVVSSYTARTTAFASATGITDATILGALNTFDLGLISNGLDSKMKAVYPFVGGTSSTHKYNFMDARDLDAAYRLSFSGDVTFSNLGIYFNGVNGYANTFLTPNLTSLSLNSLSVSVYLRDDNIQSGISFIARDTVSGSAGISLWRYLTNTYISANSPESNTSTNVTKGFYNVSRNSSTQMKLIKNGAVVSTISQNSANLPNNPLTIGAYGVPPTMYYFDKGSYSFMHISDGMTDAQATTFYNLVQAMQTTLSRNI